MCITLACAHSSGPPVRPHCRPCTAYCAPDDCARCRGAKNSSFHLVKRKSGLAPASEADWRNEPYVIDLKQIGPLFAKTVDNFVDILPRVTKILGKSRLSTRRLEKKHFCILIKIKHLASTLVRGTVFEGIRPAADESNNICEQVEKIRGKHPNSCYAWLDGILTRPHLDLARGWAAS